MEPGIYATPLPYLVTSILQAIAPKQHIYAGVGDKTLHPKGECLGSHIMIEAKVAHIV